MHDTITVVSQVHLSLCGEFFLLMIDGGEGGLFGSFLLVFFW